MSIVKEASKAIEKLNSEIYDLFEKNDRGIPQDNLCYEDLLPLFKLCTDGNCAMVDFMGGYQLWFSDEDEREFFDDEDEYEPIEQFLRREAQKIIDQPCQIKLIKEK